MKIKTIISLTAAIVMTACQADSYQISASGDGLADGDTLFFTTDLAEGTPSDTIVVAKGKFQLTGKADSTYLCMIYNARHPEINVPFFIEPGSIKLHIAKTPGASRVSGTLVNNEWQRMNDSIMVVGREINNIAEHIYGQDLSYEEQQQGMARIDQLNSRFKAIVKQFAQQNIRNEFGYFILTYYPEEVLGNDDFMQLVEQMPDEMRQRTAIQEIEQQIGRTPHTAEEAIIEDITMDNLQGQATSLLNLIGQQPLTIIDFWASWCGPCRQEMPLMVSLYNTYKDKGLGIIGISLDSDRQAWQRGTQELGITWPQMSDLQGWDNAAAKRFGITAIPHTIIVNQQGQIVQRGLRGTELQQFIASQLK